MPKDFWWGTAIENTWLAQQERGERQLDEFEVTQHYRFLKEDIRLAADLGIDMVRYSAPWYRINPERGRFEWDWLDRAVDRWSEHGIEIFYDFVHYGTPLWVDNTYLNADYPKFVAEYAARLAERYRERIRYFTPFNEPFNAMYRGGRTGVWPPYLRGDDGYVKVVEGICRGIVETVAALRDVQPDAQIMTANPLSAARDEEDSREDGRPLLRDYMFATEDLVSGRVRAGHPLFDYFRRWGMREETLTWFQNHAFEPDIFGVNYYPTRFYDRPNDDPDHIYNTERYSPAGVTVPLDWTPEERVQAASADFEKCLRSTAKHAGRPLFVTETSGGYTDQEKIDWLHASTEVIRRLRDEGVDIVGYLWWPLFDAVRWDYREGRRPAHTYIWQGRWNNGLYRLRPRFDGTLERVPTAAVDAFRSVVSRSSTRGVLASHEKS